MILTIERYYADDGWETLSWEVDTPEQAIAYLLGTLTGWCLDEDVCIHTDGTSCNLDANNDEDLSNEE